MPVSNDELVEAILRPIDEAFKSEGITPTYLAKLLKKELKAKETKVFHNKDIIPHIEQCPKCKEGVYKEKKCKLCKGIGHILISSVVYSKDLVAWEIRQKARQDAHQIMGQYPAKKHEVGGQNGQPIEITVTRYGSKAKDKPTT